MGSSGQRRRKKTKHQHHLPKVGHESAEASLHERQQGVLDAMGIRGLSPATRTIIIAAVVVLFVGAIIGLVVLNTF